MTIAVVETIWSKVTTFRWLNPLFKRGRNQKLELYHITICPSFRKSSKCFSFARRIIPETEDGRFFIAKSHNSGRMEIISCKCSFCSGVCPLGLLVKQQGFVYLRSHLFFSSGCCSSGFLAEEFRCGDF
ncbi:uncharacterized protein LOC133712269 [Rosa rugosa]|uniref:uncharacterized protein LOC133712269 n=1 Tax=Rosa rugosa TaxID=74645 RepID=UPI002B40BFC1|nr:uncharacterized protein LOC133712269 [Rosa rugosa]